MYWFNKNRPCGFIIASSSKWLFSGWIWIILGLAVLDFVVWFFYQFRVSNSGFFGPFWSLWFIKRMGNWGTKSSFPPIKQINLRNCKNVEGVPNSIIIIFCYPLWVLCGPFSFFMNWVGSWDHKLSLLLIKPALKPFYKYEACG